LTYLINKRSYNNEINLRCARTLQIYVLNAHVTSHAPNVYAILYFFPLIVEVLTKGCPSHFILTWKDLQQLSIVRSDNKPLTENSLWKCWLFWLTSLDFEWMLFWWTPLYHISTRWSCCRGQKWTSISGSKPEVFLYMSQVISLM
jgi:hypothetical protein